jgi:FHS family L-fucose permease-like MFS transporter
MVYAHFLGTLFILAGGLFIPETTANPFIIAMGPEESGTQNLNLAQSFSLIGSISGVILIKYFILAPLNQADAVHLAIMSEHELIAVRSAELNATMGPYVGLAMFLLLLWLLIAFVKMPKASDKSNAVDLIPTLGRLLKNKRYSIGVLTQFFYVGAQIGVWSFTIRYVMQELGINEEKSSIYYIAALVLFITLRFVFTGLMKFFSPGRVLTISAGGPFFLPWLQFSAVDILPFTHLLVFPRPCH